MLFMAGSGCPNANDLRRGRRPGDLAAYIETLKLAQTYDVIHMLGPCVEPQDVPIQFRHFEMMRGQLAYCDKPMFVYARGSEQVQDSFENDPPCFETCQRMISRTVFGPRRLSIQILPACWIFPWRKG